MPGAGTKARQLDPVDEAFAAAEREAAGPAEPRLPGERRADRERRLVLRRLGEAAVRDGGEALPRRGRAAGPVGGMASSSGCRLPRGARRAPTRYSVARTFPHWSGRGTDARFMAFATRSIAGSDVAIGAPPTEAVASANASPSEIGHRSRS